ncbi:Papilin-like protein [Leptotrombidium deliense]|uniref:Papilin-like protein n=1 Tax=Leptotrombidium deliense TaxID=299467 RepID=A0A443RYH0_9ACAR|nr:Papilin-like protein [Leptotrombidium deliense]
MYLKPSLYLFFLLSWLLPIAIRIVEFNQTIIYPAVRRGGQKDCGKNEIFVECGSACEDTCENYRNTFRPCTLQCVIGCKCVEPNIRNANGECVRKEQC